MLAQEVRKIQALSELDKQSTEAAEVEARILSFQSRITEFKRNAATNAPRSKLTIDALRTEPHLLLIQERTDSLTEQSEAVCPSPLANKDSGNDDRAGEHETNSQSGSSPQRMMSSISDASIDSSNTMVSNPPSRINQPVSPISESVKLLSAAHITQPFDERPTADLLAIASLQRVAQEEDPSSAKLDSNFSVPSLPRAMSLPSTSLLPGLPKPQPVRKSKSSKVFASMISENNSANLKSATAGAAFAKVPKLRNMKTVLADCTNLV